MLCSNSQNQANYAHCHFVPINNMLLISLNLHILLICDNSFGNLDFMTALFQITTKKRQATAILDYVHLQTTHYNY